MVSAKFTLPLALLACPVAAMQPMQNTSSSMVLPR